MCTYKGDSVQYIVSRLKYCPFSVNRPTHACLDNIYKVGYQ